MLVKLVDFAQEETTSARYFTYENLDGGAFRGGLETVVQLDSEDATGLGELFAWIQTNVCVVIPPL